MRCSLLTLSCYLDSELDARQHGEMEAHLVGCPRCRAGLSHLREEVERMGGLARVRVPDRSARAMLELLGLIAPGQALPPRPAAPPDAPASELPWLGAQVGQALPWVAPPKVPRRPGPVPATTAAPQTAAPSPALDEPPVLTAPAAAPGRTAEEEAAREEADVALMAPLELLRAAPPITPAALIVPDRPAPAEPVAPATPAAPETPPGLATSSAPAAPAAASSPTPAAPEMLLPLVESAAPAAPGAAGPSDAPASPRPPAAPYFVGSAMAAGARQAPSASEPSGDDAGIDGAAATVAGPDATSRDPQPPLGAPIATPTPPAPPQPTGTAPAPPPPSGETPVAVSLSDTDEARSPQAGPAADAEAQDALLGALLAEAPEGPGPLTAPRPSLFERFREKLAVRRALSGHPDADLEGGVEVVSGMGAPLRRGSSRADLARRRNDALRPATPDAAPAALGRDVPVRQMLPPAAHPSAPKPSPPTNLYGTPVDPFGRMPRAEPPPPGLQRASTMAPPPPSAPAPGPRAFVPPHVIEEQRVAAIPPPITGRPPAAEPEPAGRRPASPSELKEGRRLLLLYVGAVVVLFVIGLVSARTTTPLPVSSTATSSTSTSTSSSASSTAQQPAGQQPAATHPTAAPVAPSSAPAVSHPTAAPPAGPQTVGAGGSGWQIQQFRFGDHGTYYLMVLDIAGSGPPPTVTVASQDAQTLLLTVAGTAAATLPVLPPPGGWVSHVALVSPSPTPGAAVYRISLSKPGTGRPSLLTGPSRIVVEIR